MGKLPYISVIKIQETMTNEEKSRETYPLPRGCKDYIDQFLWDEMRLLPGCCSSIGCLKYDIAREVAIKMAAWKEQQMISQAKEFIAEYFYEHPHTSWLICSDEFQDLDDCFERLERYLKED